MPRLPRRSRPDPYCYFKDDKELGLTLRSRHRCNAVALVAVAVVTLLATPVERNPLLHALAWLAKMLPTP